MAHTVEQGMSVSTNRLVKAIMSRVARNPFRAIRGMARGMGVAANHGSIV